MQLNEIVQTSSLDEIEGQMLIAKFGSYENIAREWESKAKEIVVTREDQTIEMAMAKEARRKFSQLRIDVEKARKGLKEQSLRKGQAIDAIARYLISLIQPIETHLRLQEDFVKIRDEQKRQQEAEAARIKAEQEAEAERVAKEKKAAAEHEKIRLENEKLRKEAEKREKVIAKANAEKQKLQAEIKVKEDQEAAEKLRVEKEAEQKESDRLEALKKPSQDQYKKYIAELLAVPQPVVKSAEVAIRLEKIKNWLLAQTV